MPEKTQKELIQQLLHKVDDSNVKLDTLKQNHYKLAGSVQEIITELKGTSFDPEKGMVAEVKRNGVAIEKANGCIGKMKRSQARREGIVGTITVFFAAAVTIFLNWLFGNNGG